MYDRYCARAFMVARSVCRDSGQAEDAVQEGFLSLWRSRDSYQPQAAGAAAWIMSIVRHRAIDVVRHNRQQVARRTSDEALVRHPAPDDVAGQAIAQTDASDLRGLFEALPEAQREVIILAFYGQLTHSEISEHLNLPPGTVKGRMRLGLEKLRTETDR
ncbi:MAG: sigma-70 family RNA polymerase sigma factor [Actinomycetota bacterium]|nr:sigma-70 family RNA polymerase sigma factor [Actinomycetota bacterium]